MLVKQLLVGCWSPLSAQDYMHYLNKRVNNNKQVNND